GCGYPQTCVTGSKAVVKQYLLNDAANLQRPFKVEYRDGRSDRLGEGWLGFGMRIIRDLDKVSTGDRDVRDTAGVAELYDNSTYSAALKLHPFAGQVYQTWNWVPGSPTQPQPDQLELGYTTHQLDWFLSFAGTAFFTLPTVTRTVQAEATWSPSAAQTLLQYVGAAQANPPLVRSDA